MTNTGEMEKKTIQFLNAYFHSAFTVTIFLVVFKLLGFPAYSWAWATIPLWLPLIVLLGSILTASVFLYVGFLIPMLGSFLNEKVSWIRNHLKI